MIKINLSRKKKSQGFDLSQLFSFGKGSKQKDVDIDLPSDGKFNFRKSSITRVVGALVALYLISGMIDEFKSEEIQKLNNEIAKVEKQVTQYQAKLSQVKGFEKVKQQLEQDENSIRVKYEVITKLIKDRSSPSNMLLQVAKFIPEEVWLTNMTLIGENIRFIGGTAGYNEVSDFIKALSSSSYFENISLSNVQDSAGFGVSTVKTQSFEINAQKRKVL